MPAETIAMREASLEIEDGVAQFVHQRPARRNPLSAQLQADYADMLDRVQADSKVRVLIIAGEGGAFCAGGDLRSLQERLDSENPAINSPDGMLRRVFAAHTWFERLRSLPMPVIAAVDGAAVGAGMSLALAADFILASDTARFSMSFVRIGLVPDLAGLYVLPRLVGMAAARDMILTGRTVDAQEARALGIVHSVHPAVSLRAVALDFAHRFRGASAHALGQSKRLLNMSFETPYGVMKEFEANAQAIASSTPDHAEAMRRFLNGEPALFDWDRPRPLKPQGQP